MWLTQACQENAIDACVHEALDTFLLSVEEKDGAPEGLHSVYWERDDAYGTILPSSRCTGCAACVDEAPVGSLRMTSDPQEKATLRRAYAYCTGDL
jgi:ferredoxin